MSNHAIPMTLTHHHPSAGTPTGLSIVAIVVPVVLGVILCVVVAVVADVLWHVHKRRRWRRMASPVARNVAKEGMACIRYCTHVE